LAATTINAFTLAGTVSGGGNQINNVVIGTSTPLAGSFTTLTASTSLTTPTVVGGSAVGSSLTLQSTSAAGTTDQIKMLIGNNGGSQVVTIRDSDAACGAAGCVIIGTGATNPGYLFELAAPAGQHALMQLLNNTTGYGAG